MDHHCEAITETYRQLAALHGSWLAISLGQLIKHKLLIYGQHDLTQYGSTIVTQYFNHI